MKLLICTLTFLLISFVGSSQDSTGTSGDSTMISLELGPNQEVCGTEFTIQPTITGDTTGMTLSYLWSDSSTASSLTGVETGKYWLDLLNADTVVASDTVEVMLSPAARFHTIVNNGPTCVPSTVDFTDSGKYCSPIGFDKRVWYFGDGDSLVTSQDKISASHEYTAYGSYTAVMKIVGFFDDVYYDTLLIDITPIDSSVVDRGIINGDSVQSACVGNPVTITTDLDGSFTWTSDFVAHNFWSNSFVATKPGVYYLEGTYNYQNITCTAKDTVTIEWAESLAARFSAVDSGVFTKQFLDKSITCEGRVISSWLWNFGDGSSSSLKDPVHRYSRPGTYTVNLLTKSDNIESNFSHDIVVPVINGDEPTTPQLSIPRMLRGSVQVFNNASVPEFITVETSDKLSYALYSNAGQLLAKGQLSRGVNTIFNNHLRKGLFYLELRASTSERQVEKILKF